MSSIAAGANPERTNRWLLIGAAALAVVFGVLVFAILANVDGSDNSPKTAGSGDSSVLVANQMIKANTKITGDMFDTQKVSASSLVSGAISEKSAAIGKVTRSDILKGEQISESRLGVVNGKTSDDLAYKIPEGKRGVAVNVDESKLVGGFVVPGDHVDVIGIFTENRGSGQNSEITRVETVLQNVEVLAVAQESLKALPSKDASGTPVAADQAQGELGTRPENLDPKPSARTASLALSPQDVQKLIAADAKGDIVLVLRPAGDEKSLNLDELNLDSYGFLGPLARP